LSFFLNIVLNPLFIFGYSFIPAMGMKGIAIATILSQIIGFLILLNKIIKSSKLKGLKIKYFYPNIYILKNIFFQSAPITVALFMIAIGNFIILVYISIYGEYAAAGFGSATRFEQILLLPILGLNTAIISIIGQNFGAKQFSRVKESYKQAIFYGVILMIFSGMIIYFSANKIVSIFSEDKSVIEFGSIYLKISAFIFPAYPIYFITNGFFMAIKKSNYSMYFNIIRNVFLPLPTILLANFIGASFNSFFWCYGFFNWVFALSLLTYIHFYFKKVLQS